MMARRTPAVNTAGVRKIFDCRAVSDAAQAADVLLDDVEPDDFVPVFESDDFVLVEVLLSDDLVSEPLPLLEDALLDDEPRLSVR
jgi:hypothetical protein